MTLKFRNDKKKTKKKIKIFKRCIKSPIKNIMELF